MKDDPPEHIKAIVKRDFDEALSFEPVDDPLLGPTFGSLHRMTCSLLHRNGWLLQKVLTQILAETPGFAVLPAHEIRVSADADRLAYRRNPIECLETELPYDPEGPRAIKPDLIVYRTATGRLELLEIKRGQAKLGAGSIRSQTRDLLCLQMMGRSWARQHHLDVTDVRALVVSLFGQTGLSPDLTVYGDELDDHFGFPVTRHLDTALSFARRELERRLPAVVDRTGQPWTPHAHSLA